jgi:hypothetical protein
VQAAVNCGVLNGELLGWREAGVQAAVNCGVVANGEKQECKQQ